MRSGDGTTVDDIFDLLSHNRRRLALQYFKQNGEIVDIEHLARQVVQWEQSATASPAEVEVEEVETAFERTHLPKFEEAGLVEVRPDEGRIRPDTAAIVAAMESARNVIEFLYDESAVEDEYRGL